MGIYYNLDRANHWGLGIGFFPARHREGDPLKQCAAVYVQVFCWHLFVRWH